VKEQRTAATRTRQPGWDEQADALLQDWHNRAAAAQHSHYLIAHRLRRRNLALGVPAVVFSSVVGTSLFATLSHDNVNSGLRGLIGGVSVLAAVAAALQSFFRFAERAAQHVTAADWYAAIRRDTEQLLAMPRSARGPVKSALDTVRTQMNRAGQNAPEIAAPLWTTMSARYHVNRDAATAIPRRPWRSRSSIRSV
jgi:hypothetical protein